MGTSEFILVLRNRPRPRGVDGLELMFAAVRNAPLILGRLEALEQNAISRTTTRTRTMS